MDQGPLIHIKTGGTAQGPGRYADRPLEGSTRGVPMGPPGGGVFDPPDRGGPLRGPWGPLRGPRSGGPN